jgi:hypothetical protein
VADEGAQAAPLVGGAVIASFEQQPAGLGHERLPTLAAVGLTGASSVFILLPGVPVSATISLGSTRRTVLGSAGAPAKRLARPPPLDKLGAP